VQSILATDNYTVQSQKRNGLHVGVIMDGNGRWATRRGLPRAAGHRAGVAAVRRVVEHAPELGIGTLTVYAFSADNWRRPSGEVQTIFRLLRAYLRLEREKLRKRGAQLKAIGRRDRIPQALLREILDTEAATAECDRLQLRVAIDYSSREAITMAAARVLESELRSAGSEMRSSHPMPSAAADDLGWGTPDRGGSSTPVGEGWGTPAGRKSHRALPSIDALRPMVTEALTAECGDVDLLIRTGGEKRLSDFLLWESAYAELHFTDRMWPEFGPADLEAAVADFRHRQRRFGSVPDAALVPVAVSAGGAR
jgi:undecaprenyl diphosphate synthase